MKFTMLPKKTRKLREYASEPASVEPETQKKSLNLKDTPTYLDLLYQIKLELDWNHVMIKINQQLRFLLSLQLPFENLRWLKHIHVQDGWFCHCYASNGKAIICKYNVKQ